MKRVYCSEVATDKKKKIVPTGVRVMTEVETMGFDSKIVISFVRGDFSFTRLNVRVETCEHCKPVRIAFVCRNYCKIIYLK